MAMHRREFLKSLASLGCIGSVGSLAIPRQATAAAPDFNDYKALVCIFLYGGNDAFNMLIPTSTDANKGYEPYADARGNLAVNNTDLGIAQVTTNSGNLNQGVLGAGQQNPYNQNLNQSTAYTRGIYPLSGKGIDLGVNGVMPELAQLIIDNRTSILANSGTLVRPVTRDEIIDNSAELPVYLFAHNHQQRILQTGQANNLNDIGWAGKIADQWHNINQNSPLGLNISYAGNDRMLIGNSSSPLVLNPGNVPKIHHLSGDSNTNTDRRALFNALAGIEGSTTRLDFGADRTDSVSDPFRTLYNNKEINAVATFDQLKQSWDSLDINYATTGSYGEALFDIPTAQQIGFSQSIRGNLIRQLEAVAKMIHLGASGNLGAEFNRQIFFVELGGFDTHATQASQHPLLLRELSLGLWKFQKAMEELGYADSVTSFTMSDFGRTLSFNGDGTDHAWGSHQLVMGGYGSGESGTLRGGAMIGDLPEMLLSGNDDYSNKGRMIPTLSQDQVNAPLTQWFGVDQSQIPTLFPNIRNFQTGGGIETAFAPIFV
ncbi:MAG: DUF1501 domain-containing protein [Candidatus Thiodiazotropha lotti]|uniref:DUF1501 domain-containing protein n=1 Tax=Candidatus Thiodiazotropha endoloripes TaxID=1818881 RepID=UPI0009F3D24B|nr:DUF1501 domain-containing protein [Candidatus Thiodiazotropha endoloripes]MCG7990335.1 DUF1501 domain-containing protein [Candidatus Thiodiazotropha lotti]MCG7999028.1 DUF1501 domain-containing protein [Candidatus Thiodiazotropha lotti]MCW4181989.1 DUF1501 domain-containing protein [Candidatus Thiodiazotropha weberae]MCW4190796.1 DUF1501 domain-containing protein [Candidatus Thiodiazotropha weberae]